MNEWIDVMKDLKDLCSSKLRSENAAPKVLIFDYSSHFICIYDLSQLNKTQYNQIHLTAVTSLSPPLDHEDMTFSVFCGHLS